MILQLSSEYYGPGVSIAFPTTADQVRQKTAELRSRDDADHDALFIRDEGIVWHFAESIKTADLFSETGIQKLNRLSETVDAMDHASQQVFAGALRAESINGVDDILRIASSLEQYELIEGVTSDKELGGWVVEHGLAGVNFPKETWPYLDYAGLGAKYYADHGGAYTPSGYVKRRETPQEQAVADKSQFALTLISVSGSYRLNLPANDEQLEQARQALKVGSLGGVIFSDIRIDYPWEHLIPLDGILLADANTLAQYVQQMSDSELRLFGAALEAEEPGTFSDAVCIAEDLDDYELVDGSESEYGRKALRYAGAGDEILDMLDGFTDFDTLGRFEMEQDGVRDTDYGPIKRLSSPFPQQAEQGQTMC